VTKPRCQSLESKRLGFETQTKTSAKTLAPRFWDKDRELWPYGLESKTKNLASGFWDPEQDLVTKPCWQGVRWQSLETAMRYRRSLWAMSDRTSWLVGRQTTSDVECYSWCPLRSALTQHAFSIVWRFLPRCSSVHMTIRAVTCRMGSRSVTCHPAERTFPRLSHT